jgi:hypothetical protein
MSWAILAYGTFMAWVGFTVGAVWRAHRADQQAAWDRALGLEVISQLVVDLTEAEERARYLARQLVEAERTDEVRATVPPDVWRNLMEAREQPEVN